ncbi:MAG TPA: tripartite tricarboxylate transporter TctB family protein [Xanthobacteraceae bacterium]
MSEGVHSSAGEPRRHSWIGNPRDFWGGVVLVGFALFALWAAGNLPGMRGFAFGPGTAPRLFAWLLVGIGVLVALIGMVSKGPRVERIAIRGPLLGAVLVVAFALVSRYSTPLVTALGMRQGETVVAALVVFLITLVIARGEDRGPLYVTAGILIFAGTIRPLGLILATFASVMVSAAATLEVRWRETLLWALALTAFCVLLFVYALNLPFVLWPRF